MNLRVHLTLVLRALDSRLQSLPLRIEGKSSVFLGITLDFKQPAGAPFPCLSLGRVFQFHVLCRLQASFRDMGQNSTFRRPVDSAMCGPELKQSLVLKNACKEPPNGFKGAPSQQLRRPATRKPALAGF